MKASELLIKLQSLIALHGDLSVVMQDWTDHWNTPAGVESIRYATIDTENIGGVFVARYGFLLDD